MNDISTAVFMHEGMILGIFYKIELDPTPDIFKLLEYMGVEDWKAEMNVAVKDRYPIYFVIGIGRVSPTSFDRVTSIMYSEMRFFVGDGSDVLDDRLTIGNVAGFVEGDDGLEALFESSVLEIPLSSKNQKKCKSLEAALDADVVYESDEDDVETLEFRSGREGFLGKLESLGEGLYHKNWDDFDDLASLSAVWDFEIDLTE